MKKLSIIIPVYNEERTILKLIEKVKKVDIVLDKEIIVVDDGSSDATPNLLKKIKGTKVIFAEKNIGKGAAIRKGLSKVTGDIVIIQDADLEYDVRDYNKLIEPIIKGKAEVVYGSRNLNKGNKKHSGFFYYIGGIFLSLLANLLYGTNITDEATCYKVFKTSIIKSIDLKCNKFEFCPEITAKIAKKGIKIFEVPIRYEPRSKKEGKKIRWIDGIQAVFTLIKYRFIE